VYNKHKPLNSNCRIPKKEREGKKGGRKEGRKE
jgi:hypothetical protein